MESSLHNRRRVPHPYIAYGPSARRGFFEPGCAGKGKRPCHWRAHLAGDREIVPVHHAKEAVLISQFGIQPEHSCKTISLRSPVQVLFTLGSSNSFLNEMRDPGLINVQSPLFVQDFHCTEKESSTLSEGPTNASTPLL